MITIKVDEGYAYDYLSILDVKRKKNLKNSEEAYHTCFSHIKNQIGEQKHLNIINSEKYLNLVNTNFEVFDAVEKARYGYISAKEVDDLNMKRYNHKIALQNEFFSGTKILEYKT